MNQIKLLAILSVGAFSISLNAGAQNQNTAPFVCDGGNHRIFSATLDFSNYPTNSGFSKMKAATFKDNFISADFLCQTQNRPGLFGCVGFEFNRGFKQSVIYLEVNTNSETGKPTLIFDGEFYKRTWSCK